MSAKGFLYVLTVYSIMAIIISLLFVWASKENETRKWQHLYWAPNDPVMDESGAQLMGRVIDGEIEIARDE